MGIPAIVLYMFLISVVALLMALCEVIGILIRQIKKYRKMENYRNGPSMVWRNDANGQRVLLSMGFAVVISLALLGGLIYISMDVPYLFSGNLEIVTGEVVSHDSAGREDVSDTRGIRIKDTTSGEVVHVVTVYTPIRMGEVYEIYYLPYTHFGAIVRKIE